MFRLAKLFSASVVIGAYTHDFSVVIGAYTHDFSVVSPRNRHLLDAHDLHHLIRLHPLISAMMLIVDGHATDVNRKYIK